MKQNLLQFDICYLDYDTLINLNWRSIAIGCQLPVFYLLNYVLFLIFLHEEKALFASILQINRAQKSFNDKDVIKLTL